VSGRQTVALGLPGADLVAFPPDGRTAIRPLYQVPKGDGGLKKVACGPQQD
jgi:hypothetical protein